MSVKKADIHFRIPEPEKEVIAEAAEMAGKGLSEYARDILMAASDYEKTNNTYAQKDPLKISEAAPLNCSISIRCSEEELNYYREQAKIADCSMPEYIRACANGQRIIVVPGLKDVVRQIAKLGVNVNQLTLLAHQGKIKEVDLFATNDTLKQILKTLTKIAKKE